MNTIMLPYLKTRIFYTSLFILLTAIIFFGCKKSEIVDGNDLPEITIITVSGQVINVLTGVPIENANVIITGLAKQVTFLTDAQGKYKGDIEASSNSNLSLVTYKEGFISDTTNVVVSAGSTLSVPVIELEPVNSGSIPSGDPVSIFLSSQSASSIGVKESGSEETARLIFTIQDSAGIPIDIAHSVDVQFRFGSAPGGGEILSPSIVKTNNSGQAIVNLTSGTKAGTVQIIAEMNLAGKKITSLPVSITIHGGMPDQVHFSVASSLLNFPGYNIYGLLNPVTAFVGDKYSNPVREGTSVYFSTTGGIIEGSAKTDLLGTGTVNLMSANPKPNHPIFGPGFAAITATTSDENQNQVSDETIVLFSGIPQININPTSIDVPNGGSQFFNYTVSDQNGNPLSGGTGINVTLEGENVKIQGDIDIQIPDTQSKAWTLYSFTLYDAADSVNAPKAVTVKVKTTGPNGAASMNISGIAR